LEEKKLLYPLSFPFFLLSFSGLGTACPQDNRSCSVPLQEQLLTEQSSTEQPSPGQSSTEQSLPGDSLKIIEMMKNDKDFQSFLTTSSQQRDSVLRDPEIQNFVATLQDQIATQGPQPKHKSVPPNPAAELYLFVSFSLGEKALLNLAQEAKAYGATLILKGFIEGSYAKTVKALQAIITKTGQGVSVDPELFTLFNVKAVPTYVLSKPFQLNTLERNQTPIHDRIQGHISLQYALEKFAKEGDLQEEASSLLANVPLKREASK
jgi:type-F conjugative transfer system pilin assembly protein TrbC